MYKFPEAAALVEAELVQTGRAEIVPTIPVSEAMLDRVHARQYQEQVRSHGLSRYARNRLGLPAHPRLYDRSRYGAGGTVQALEAALDDGIACNLAGGTHHAFPDRGQGFCVFNDGPIAIRHLQARYPELTFMVVDTDAHQGNATHAFFRGDPMVFTYSIHVAKNFPSKKEPGDVDVGLPRYASEDAYLEALEQTLEPAVLQAEPDVVIWISGADVHKDDRFGQLQLTLGGIRERDDLVLGILARHQIPTAVVYGGGYNRERHMTARIHANSVLAAADWAERFKV